MKTLVRPLIFISLLLLFSGCYFRSSVTALNSTPASSPAVASPLSENRHFIPGAQKSVSTVKGYQKSSVVGHHQGQMVKNSLVKNYKLYSTVEGQIISSPR